MTKQGVVMKITALIFAAFWVLVAVLSRIFDSENHVNYMGSLIIAHMWILVVIISSIEINIRR